MVQVDAITKAFAVTDRALREFFPHDYHKRCMYASFGLATILRDKGIEARIVGGDFICAVVSKDRKRMALQGFSKKGGTGPAHYWVEAQGELLDLGLTYLPCESSYPAAPLPVLRWPLGDALPAFVAYRERIRYATDAEIDNVELRARNSEFVTHCRSLADHPVTRAGTKLWQLRNFESLRYSAGQGDLWAQSVIEFVRRSLKARFPVDR